MYPGCGSAIASSSFITEHVKGMTLDQAGKVKNTEIAKELSLPPVKLHCSMLAEDAIKVSPKGISLGLRQGEVSEFGQADQYALICVASSDASLFTERHPRLQDEANRGRRVDGSVCWTCYCCPRCALPAFIPSHIRSGLTSSFARFLPIRPAPATLLLLLNLRPHLPLPRILPA